MAPFLLSVVLVLQVLPGHFQLAFQTQVDARPDGRLGDRSGAGSPTCAGGEAVRPPTSRGPVPHCAGPVP